MKNYTLYALADDAEWERFSEFDTIEEAEKQMRKGSVYCIQENSWEGKTVYYSSLGIRSIFMHNSMLRNLKSSSQDPEIWKVGVLAILCIILGLVLIF